MGQTKSQFVSGICNQVAWLSWRDRLTILRAILTAYATDENGKRIHGKRYRS